MVYFYARYNDGFDFFDGLLCSWYLINTFFWFLQRSPPHRNTFYGKFYIMSFNIKNNLTFLFSKQYSNHIYHSWRSDFFINVVALFSLIHRSEFPQLFRILFLNVDFYFHYLQKCNGALDRPDWEIWTHFYLIWASSFWSM